MKTVELLNEYFFGVAVPIGLIFIGIFYCFKLKFFHLARPRVLLRALFEKGSGKAGEVSPYKALTLALAGTLGVGNIVGVASAIYLGGAGAVFWMWISALCAMILKYAEIVLAVRHRRKDSSGAFYGGAPYYIKDFFSSRKMYAAAAIIPALFAVLCVANAFSMGSMIQANAVSSALEGVLGVKPVFTAVALALLTLAVTARGTGGIVKLTEILVPVMSLGYLLLSGVIILKNANALPSLVRDIVSSAFSLKSAGAGALGFVCLRAIRYGSMRGLLSNEAGCGTAPAAHAASNADSAAKQGVFGIVEVFVDTIILCTMTAFVLLLGYGDAALHGGNFIMMTFSAYSSFFGKFAEIFMCVAVMLFGFATIACWAHYGFESIRYFSGRRFAKYAFIFAYSASAFVGAVMSADIVWQSADFAIGLMTVINLAMLVLMSSEVREETDTLLNNGAKKRKK